MRPKLSQGYLLILAYKRGVVDRHELIRLADIAVDEQEADVDNSYVISMS